jgi:hypothetical protein
MRIRQEIQAVLWQDHAALKPESCCEGVSREFHSRARTASAGKLADAERIDSEVLAQAMARIQLERQGPGQLGGMPPRLRLWQSSNIRNQNRAALELASRCPDFEGGFLLSVADVQQPKLMKSANVSSRNARTEGVMLRFTQFTTDGRLLGFDTGDWSMLLGGFVLAGLLTLFV